MHLAYVRAIQVAYATSRVKSELTYLQFWQIVSPLLKLMANQQHLDFFILKLEDYDKNN